MTDKADEQEPRVSAVQVAKEISDLVEGYGIRSYAARINVLFIAVMNLVGVRGFRELQDTLAHQPKSLGEAERDEFFPRRGAARTNR
ncbi:hypothetical protein NYO91_07405 [Arhodomonas aquaeolei]|uniref:hypothetical protein n=1 Tax=Arhodomonas aquaeolei TaxID=2369 RepID=UPI002168585A|nr:hypothetical protein [Arhodomonas aquaeolei]MCS4503903.1 hypothetical protein [Arhodomonas aquaeolei]